jgi:hypothetical protein
MFYRHDSGVWYARHFPGGAHPGGHRITPKSDEHLRAQDYTERAFTDAGYTAAQEVTTDNRTRIDVVALDSPRVCGFEIQLGNPGGAAIKARTTRSMHATAIRGPHARQLPPGGILPVWFSPVRARSDWLYTVPTVETQDVSWTGLPPAGTVTAIGVRRIVDEKCTPGSRWPNCPRLGGGFCRGTHPLAELVTGLTIDSAAAMTAAAQLIPLRYFTGRVFLVDPASAVLYEELGGQRGEYAAGSAPQASPGTLLGPCRHPGHKESEPEPGPPRPAVSPPGESSYPSLIRDIIGDPDGRELRVGAYADLVRSATAERERREQEERERRERPRLTAGYDQRIRQSVRDKQEAASWCDVPGCTAPGRPYMCGTRCDQHKPQGGHA